MDLESMHGRMSAELVEGFQASPRGEAELSDEDRARLQALGYLDDALGHMVRRRGVWAATGSQIIDWYRSHRPGK